MSTDPTIVPLPAMWRQTWLETRAAMQWTQPGLTSLLYSMMNQDGGDSVFWFTTDIPTLQVDGRRIWANPVFFFGLPIRQRIFAGFHEVMHAVWRHPEILWWHREGNHPVVWNNVAMPFDTKRAIRAMDYVVNAQLIAGDVGEYNPDWLYDPLIATHMTTWQEAYAKLVLLDQQQQQQGQPGQGPPQPQQGGGQQPQPGPGQPSQAPGGSPPPQAQGAPAPQPGQGTPADPDLQGPQDYHAKPGTSQGKAADDPGVKASDMEWKVAIKAAIATGEKAGKMPAAILEAFGEVLETHTPWPDHLQGLLARGLGGGGYNHRKPDRRFLMRQFYIPARSGKGCNTVVIVGDSSGSIYRIKGLIDKIFAETKAVLETVKPKRIVLVWCDAKVQRVDHIEDAADLEVTYRTGAKGGGGTKFMPAFRWVDDNLDDVDALVYFTDGENDAKEVLVEPLFPVIWGKIGGKEREFPFGDKLVIPTDGSA